MIGIVLRIYLMGVIISSILSALTIYLLKEDFVDENFGIFCVLFITSTVCSWYAVFQLLKELVSILKNKKRKP